MIDKQKVAEAIYKAIDEVNQQLPQDRRLPQSPDTVLAGPAASLDSLGLVNLIVVTEEMIEEEFDQLINIADQKAMSQENSPFRTVGTLTEYIASLLQETADVTL